MTTHRVCALLLSVAAMAGLCQAQVCNVKVLTDASPDYYDMDSMVRSITGSWDKPADKCWAMFYWNHIARRQTMPMHLHGLDLSDPIRQYNDYGYAMCSTISAINCSIWDYMGLKAKYWDIHVHTVAEVQFDGKFHMMDNSLSALYTLCDGKTLAGVEEIGVEGACEASGGKKEPGHVAKYHCVYSTSPNGFLQGADTARGLDEEYKCFRPPGLAYRYYYYDWDRGHRYILNIRPGESYTRMYIRPDGGKNPRAEGKEYKNDPRYYVPNTGETKGDPEAVNPRYGLRGNGIWNFKPVLTTGEYKKSISGEANIAAAQPYGLKPGKAGEAAWAVFKIEGANVIASQLIKAGFALNGADDSAKISISTTNGLQWKEVWKSDKTGEVAAEVQLIAEVSGSYEVLVKVELLAKNAADDAVLKAIDVETITQVNSKTQPHLNLGKNTVYVGAGDQSQAIVYWPELQGRKYKPLAVDEKNIKTFDQHQGWNAVMFQEKGEEAYVVFKMDAPNDLTRLVYGARMYPRAPGSHIDFLHSFDGGKTWTTDHSQKPVEAPWDVIKYVTVENIPAGTRSVLFKYSINGSSPGEQSCGIYAMRMEANYKPIDPGFSPMLITYSWMERQEDYSLVNRSHTEFVAKVPFKYTINVGGVDHPVMDSLKIKVQPRGESSKPPVVGYSDGKDVDGEKFMHKWVTYGKNLALGKPYTVSVPSGKNWGAGDPDGKRLTDGVVGPTYAGSPAPAFGLLWDQGQEPEVAVDLGKAEKCGVFRIHLSAGWPWWDAAKGEVQDKVEVFTSADGKEYASQGKFDFRLRMKDVPINFMFPDDETACGWNFSLTPAKPVEARYVKYKITAARSLVVSEVQVFDQIKYEPFDIKLNNDLTTLKK